MYGNNHHVAPIKEGEELEVTIESVGEKGDGLTRKDGFVIFVPDTQVGDKVRVKVTRVLRKVGFAEVVGQAAPSEESDEEAHEDESSEEPTDEPTDDSKMDDPEQDDSESFGEDSESFGDDKKV